MLRAAIGGKTCILQRHISTKSGCRLAAAKPRTRVRTRMITHARTLGTIPSSRCQTTCRGSETTRQDSFSWTSSGSTSDRLGGASRDRTDDLMLAKHALSQLSYGPVTRRRMLRYCARLRSSSYDVAAFALHPACLAVAGKASEGWWAWEDLNFRPHAYQARALTN